MRLRRIMVPMLLTALAMLLSQQAPACPTCYGAPDSQSTEAMNMAILSLLGITGAVLTGVVSFVVYLRRRASMLNRMFSNRLN